VLIDGGENIRAPVVASWLKQLGCDACVLEGGVGSGLKGRLPAQPALPALPAISAADLKRMLDTSSGTVFDLGASMNFRNVHIPGSRWSTRVRVAADARKEGRSVALVSENADIARLAAVDLFEAGVLDMALLDGGLPAWTRAGYPTESSPANPPDAECIDYLFFVHDRHAGNREAMRQYLAWETGLITQLDEQEKASFRIGP